MTMYTAEQAKAWTAKTFDVANLSEYQVNILEALYQTLGADIEAMNIDVYDGESLFEVYVSSSYNEYRIHANDFSYDVTVEYYTWDDEQQQRADEPYKTEDRYYRGAIIGLEDLVKDIQAETKNN